MNDALIDKVKGGLRPLPPDPRDFSHTAVFGAVPTGDLPEGDFFVTQPFKIKDQNSLDFCAAFTASEVSEDQEGCELCPEYTFAKAKQIEGRYDTWGLDLRLVCKAGCQYGFLEEQYRPGDMKEADRDYLANWKNWDPELDLLAWDHAKLSFFAVDGPYDTFDNIRMTLYKNFQEARTIITGCMWRREWTLAPGGVIPKEYRSGDRDFGHAFKIFGQKIIDGEMYLVAQLSNGEGIGDHGVFYFPRLVVNREFTFGAFTFKDLPKEEAWYYNEYKIAIGDTWVTKLIKVTVGLLKNLLKNKVKTT